MALEPVFYGSASVKQANQSSQGMSTTGPYIQPVIAGLVEAIDVNPLVEGVMRRHNLTEADARSACDDYRRFLYLCAAYPTVTIIPWTNALDLVWHEHILDTRAYARDSAKLFGGLLHHDPHIEKDQQGASIAKQTTQRLFLETFTGASASLPWLVAGAATLAAVQALYVHKREEDTEPSMFSSSMPSNNPTAAVVGASDTVSCPSAPSCGTAVVSCGGGASAGCGGGGGC